jgi:hypothetical protein
MKGMMVWVYRTGKTDCTNQGITSKHDRVMLVGPGVPEVHEVLPDEPVLFLDPRKGWDHPCLTPYAKPKTDRWVMFGGNFVWSSDSRFREHVSAGPLPVHDRVE